MTRLQLPTMPRLLLSVAGVSLLLVVFSGCATSRTAEVADEFGTTTPPDDLLSTIDEGDNVVVMDREADLLHAQPTVESFYLEAQQALEDEGFEIATASEPEQNFTTAPKMIGEELALKIQVNARKKSGGSMLVASGWWAPTVTADEGDWQRAAWTTGKSQEAFEELFEVMREVPHEGVGTDVE